MSIITNRGIIMTFVLLAPKRKIYRESTQDKIRINFKPLAKNKNIVMGTLWFGKAIAARLGFKQGDLVELWPDDVEPLKWFIKTGPDGFTVGNANKRNPETSPNYFISFTWDKEVPESCKGGTKFVNFDFYNGGIRLFLPGCPIEERKLY